MSRAGHGAPPASRCVWSRVCSSDGGSVGELTEDALRTLAALSGIHLEQDVLSRLLPYLQSVLADLAAVADAELRGVEPATAFSLQPRTTDATPPAPRSRSLEEPTSRGAPDTDACYLSVTDLGRHYRSGGLSPVCVTRAV